MTKLYILLSAGVALALHLLVGWQYAIVGSVIAGVMIKDRPIIAGILTLVATWGGLVIYTYTVAPEETTAMAIVVAAIFGDLPPIMTVLITIAVAALIGGVGGWLGSVPIKKKQQ